MIFVWWLSQDNLTIYSYFGKGCRKKCTRQSRKVWCVVLSALFFKKICTNFLSLCLVFVLSPLKPIFWLENNYNVPVARCLYFSLLIVLHQLMYHYSTENSAKEQRIDISFQNRMSKIKKRATCKCWTDCMSQAGSFNGNDFQPNINQQPATGDFLQLGRFWCTRERLCMNEDVCWACTACCLDTVSIPGLIAVYAWYSGSSYDHRSINRQALALEKPTRENNID